MDWSNVGMWLGKMNSIFEGEVKGWDVFIVRFWGFVVNGTVTVLSILVFCKNFVFEEKTKMIIIGETTPIILIMFASFLF